MKLSHHKFVRAAALCLAISVVASAGCIRDKKTAPRPVQTQAVAPAPAGKPAPAPAPVAKPAPASAGKSVPVTEKTVAVSNTLSAKAKIPQIVPDGAEYRPVFEIGSAAVSGTGSADEGKLEKLGGCLPASIFTDPEIFKGLSEMQSLALREALADACKKANADFLLAPKYELSFSSNGKETSVSCVAGGFPVKIVGFEKIAKNNPLAEELAKKLEATQNELDALKKEIAENKTRVRVLVEYLKVMKEYDVKTMEDVCRVLALMGEIAPLVECPPAAPAAEGNTLTVKPGVVTLKGNVGVAVPVEVPEIKVKIEE